MNQTHSLAYRQSTQRISKPLFLLGLSLLWLLAMWNQAYAQDLPITPISTPPLYGNYCTATGGVGLYPDIASDTFSVNVPGTPVVAYWYWSGRGQTATSTNDTDIVVAVGGAAGQTLTASQSSTSDSASSYFWHTNMHEGFDPALIQPNGTTSFTVSGLDVNPGAGSQEDHGAGVIVVYESPSCPFQKIEFSYGNDAFHHSWGSSVGTDSDVYCTTFDAATGPRNLTVDMVVGGVASDTRGNSIWYITGSGPLPTGDLVPDGGNNPNPTATEIADPLNGSSGLEWDIYTETSITINVGDTYACYQIESPEDDNGISGTWIANAVSIPVAPPTIDIIKSPDTQTVISGSVVTFTIQVQNNSPYTLTNVAVTDALTPSCDNAAIGTLGPGQMAPEYTCTASNVTAGFTNQAIVTGQPPFGDPVTDSDIAEVMVQSPQIDIVKSPDTQTVSTGASATFTITVTNTGDVTLNNVTVTDALSPNCDNNTLGTMEPTDVQTYTCTADNVTANFTNSATVVGESPFGTPVDDTDTAEVVVANPAIDIQKTPDNQTVVAGSTVTFTITVTNIGDVALNDVTVTDALSPNCNNNTLGTMAPADVQLYQCTIDNVTASFTNVADVAGTTADGITVTDTDPADVVIIGPAIDIQKTPDNQTIRPGGTVTFTIRVENTGDVELTDVAVVDPLAAQCDNQWDSLAIGAVETYECVVANVAEDFVNVASVSGQPPAGPRVDDSDDAAVDVVLPLIEISKTPDTQIVLAGQPVEFTITVTNTGDTVLNGVDLFNVQVTDELVPECNASIGNLSAGESNTYTCTLPAAQASFTNIAITTGTPSIGGDDVTDEDTADVIVISPDIDIIKTPDLQTVVAGDSVTFNIKVENTGSVTLTNVTVADPQSPVCDRVIGIMAPGAVQQYDCTLDNVNGDFINIASVSGTPSTGADGPSVPDVTDEDDANVDVIGPAISITKSPDTQMVTSDDSVDFNITVQNTGDVPLFQVAVTDPLSPNCDRLIGDLTPGQSVSYQCTLSTVSADFINVATVTGQPTIGDPVSASDNAVVDLISPSISIEKTVEESEIGPGDTAIFAIRVENTGDVVLNNVMVTDQKAPQCSRELETLNPGDVRTFTCELPNVEEGLINVAEVVGVPPTGTNVTDSDDAEVTIPPADLHITKSDGGVQTQPGGRIRYTLDYENRGQGDALDVIITEIIPANTRFNAGESDPKWACADGSVVAGTSCTYNVGTLNAGESGTIDLIFTVDVDPQLPMSITNINNVVNIGGRNNVTVSGSTTALEATPLAPTALDLSSEPTNQVQPYIFVPLISGIQ